jgi:hypothetical protein
VACGAHLFILSIDAQTGLNWQQQGEMALFLSAVWHGEAFHGLGVQDISEFDSG